MPTLKFVAPANFDASSPVWQSFFQNSGGYTEASYNNSQWTLVGTAASGHAGYTVAFTGSFTRPPSGGVPYGNITGFAVYDAGGGELYEGAGYNVAATTAVAQPAIFFNATPQPLATYVDPIAVTLTDGNDHFVGGGSRVFIYDSAGSDTITGGSGGTYLVFTQLTTGVTLDLSSTATQSAGLGQLTLSNVHGVYGSTSADLLTGTAGDDVIYGSSGSYIYQSSSGNSVYQSSGRDIIDSGAGDDTVSLATDANSSGAVVHGGDGNDTITTGYYDFTAAALAGTYIFGDAGDDTLVVASNQGSAISYVGGTGNVLDGGAGNDTFTGWEAGNTLLGGTGNDTFLFNDYRYTKVGYSKIDGGDGYDTLIIRSSNAQSSAKFITVYLAGNGPVQSGVISATNVEEVRVSVGVADSDNRSTPLPVFIYGGTENDYVVGSGTVGITVDGGGGNDRIVGTGGNDVITTGTGNDTISGGDGNDVIRPGGGVDIVDGGAGTDTLRLAGVQSSYHFVSAGGLYFAEGSGEQVQFSNVEMLQFDDATLTASAAQASATAFDGLRYIAAYPDLIAAFGTDTEAALNHLLSYGVAEFRSIESFDALRYVASNPDLARAFGTDTVAAEQHYIQHGYAEGRSTGTFDPLRYLASNPDLAKSLGADPVAAEKQYILHGLADGRPTTSFDPYEYLATNPDLIRAYGDDPVAAETHYITKGIAEGRAIASFDALRYLASNVDLAAAFGGNTVAAEQHYIDKGLAEGRSSTSFDPLQYLAANTDLAKAYGDDAHSAELHFINNGRLEGRATSGFDAIAYLLSYADLAAAGLSTDAATLHWVTNGAGEGRVGDSLYGREQTNHLDTVGSIISDALQTASDHDWFSVTLATGEHVAITMSGDGLMPDIAIADEHGNQLQDVTAAFGSNTATIDFTADHAATYYLTASSAAHTTGAYTIDTHIA